jgi:DNA-binding CsgD family transcriptional regulator
LDAQRMTFKARPLQNTLQQAAPRAGPPPSNPRVASAGEADKPVTNEKLRPASSATGFLLMDSSLSPISFNNEAIEILSYPGKPANLKRQGGFLNGKICSSLISQRPSGASPFVTEFRSGKRRYFCRAFVVHSRAKDPHPSIAVLLERGPSGLVSLSQISQQFNLTQRERESLEYLLQGLSSKEIANRMNISPNTVKAFLRLIMIKTGASSRSAVVGKVIMINHPYG